MNIKTTTYCLLFLLLASCQQFKTLTSRDNTSHPKPSKQVANKKVRFLDNISVNPGQVVTSKHASEGTAMAKTRRKGYSEMPGNAGDIERASYLQLKYAIMLDASVENLANVGLLKLIDEWWGTKYCMGGNSKECIDCSAFVQVIMSNVFEVNLPRTASEQYGSANKIGIEDLQEGDLVFFKTSGRDISHVGVYMLNNKFVHASTSSGVMFNDLNDVYWREKFKGAARVTSNKYTGTN